MFKKFAKRVQMMVGRALLETITSDGDIQLVKVSGLADEVGEGLERPQNYGLSTNPPKGAECVALYVQGNREDGLIVLMDHSPSRKKIDAGEVALYSKFAAYVHLRDDGQMELNGTGDFLVRFSKMETAFNKLKGDLNGHVHVAGLILDSTGGTCTGSTAKPTSASTASMSAAKVNTIEVP